MSPKKRRATGAQDKLDKARALVEESVNELVGCLPAMHPVLDETRDVLLQLRRTIEIVRLTIRRIP